MILTFAVPPAASDQNEIAIVLAYLRGQGCTCPLMWNGTTAVPHTPGDAAACPFHSQTARVSDKGSSCGPA